MVLNNNQNFINLIATPLSMLNKLSQALKKTTDKIANAVFLNKKEVDQIVKDLQRALIEADVNILLVKDLSDKIKKKG